MNRPDLRAAVLRWLEDRDDDSRVWRYYLAARWRFLFVQARVRRLLGPIPTGRARPVRVIDSLTVNEASYVRDAGPLGVSVGFQIGNAHTEMRRPTLADRWAAKGSARGNVLGAAAASLGDEDYGTRRLAQQKAEREARERGE